jgi:hypothetical protein
MTAVEHLSLSRSVSIAEAPGLPLGVPGKRFIPEHVGKPQHIRLPPVQDRLDDVRREAGERQEPAHVGVGYALLLSQIGERAGLTALDPPAPAVCADQGLDKVSSRIGLRGGARRAS